MESTEAGTSRGVTLWIAGSTLPVSTVESEEFREMMKFINVEVVFSLSVLIS